MYQIIPQVIPDCLELIPDIFCDERGETAKPFHSTSFRELGLPAAFQEELNVINHGHVLRGMHYQQVPYEQAKLVYCLKGEMLDVAIDIRPESPTYGEYMAIKLSAAKRNMIYIPAGFAHGYLTLSEETIVVYKMTNEYHPEAEGGIRWDSFGLDWGVAKPILSVKDTQWPTLEQYLQHNYK